MKANDPATYRDMSMPHPTPEAAAKALEDFAHAVADARKKHKIRDVFLVLRTGASGSGGVEGDVTLTLSLGNHLGMLPMLAAAYGEQKQAFVEMLDRLAGENKGEAA